MKQPCFSKEGDLWHLGKHIVLCGDSTKAECYDTLMDGTKANLVLSDPPYTSEMNRIPFMHTMKFSVWLQ